MVDKWLDGICNYDGPAADLPTGGYCKIPNWAPEKVARFWIVMDAESDEGVKEKKTLELSKDDIIIGVRMNPKTLAAILKTYGADFYKIRDANGALHTPSEWEAKYRSNGLGLVALRNMRRKISGGGIHF